MLAEAEAAAVGPAASKAADEKVIIDILQQKETVQIDELYLKVVSCYNFIWSFWCYKSLPLEFY